ncbi:MAG: ion transporter [Kiritimatiellae bacterium]|nr:ion transporter [Kiritimatiellia bacterium]
MKIKKAVFDVIQPDGSDSPANRWFDRLISILVVISVAVVFAITFKLPRGVRVALCMVETVASIVFTIEYLLRIWTASELYPGMSPMKARLRYVVSFMAIVDLVSILPFWLPMFLPDPVHGVRALRLVRLFRILKINRYFDAMKSLGDVIVSKKRELIASSFVVVLLMMVSSLLMYAVENEAQPDVFRNAFSGLWWAVATLTTVGDGDNYPVTAIGRILGAVIAFSGIAILAIPTGIVTSGLMERVDKLGLADEAEARAGKDEEHDRELREQRELLQRLEEKLNRLIELSAR